MNANLIDTDRRPAGDAAPTIGTVLGATYRIVRSIAQGGCGDVYVATHERLGREVAVKILHPSRAGSPRDLARLRQEADIMSALRHPHIVQILDFNVTDGGVPFLVMELLEGRGLSEAAAAGTPFDPRTAVHIIDQIGQALGAAHARGIVHLDLKPDNVILVSIDGRDDFVKVIDFGISRASWRARLANEPLVTGTPEYMAPEQANGLTAEINHRADQFALAAVSYRLLTGREPFSGPTLEAILFQVMNHLPPPPSQLVPGLGAGVDAVIERGMSKRSADRYPSVTAFAEALGSAIGLIATDRRHALRAPAARASEPPEVAAPTLARAVHTKAVRRRFATVLFALAAALAWFTPATRTGLRTAWHHAVGAKARMAATVANTNDLTPQK
ncbi:MAG TPA: serine/threonine-protein kinase [Polyangia bacterium]|nr:serine/threonine-protein kinase [Polyangia bacterium]